MVWELRHLLYSPFSFFLTFWSSYNFEISLSNNLTFSSIFLCLFTFSVSLSMPSYNFSSISSVWFYSYEISLLDLLMCSLASLVPFLWILSFSEKVLWVIEFLSLDCISSLASAFLISVASDWVLILGPRQLNSRILMVLQICLRV